MQETAKGKDFPKRNGHLRPDEDWIERSGLKDGIITFYGGELVV
jgi:hypothetical protein